MSRNQTKTLLGIETLYELGATLEEIGRNQTKTLLGIETLALQSKFGMPPCQAAIKLKPY